MSVPRVSRLDNKNVLLVKWSPWSVMTSAGISNWAIHCLMKVSVIVEALMLMSRYALSQPKYLLQQVSRYLCPSQIGKGPAMSKCTTLKQ